MRIAHNNEESLGSGERHVGSFGTANESQAVRSVKFYGVQAVLSPDARDNDDGALLSLELLDAANLHRRQFKRLDQRPYLLYLLPVYECNT